MIINLLHAKYRLWWIVFHVLLGVLALSSNLFVIIWFYFIIAGTFYLISHQGTNRSLLIVSTMVYLGAFEVLARMTKCSPVIPYEMSKYIFTGLSLTGILLSAEVSVKRKTGLLILLLLVPSLFIDKSGLVDSSDIVFNILGMVNIGLGIIFFSSATVRPERFYDIIRLMIFPCITILTYTIIETPDLEEFTFSLGAQAATSGRFGSNQVSTVLGLGFLLMTVFWLLNLRLTSGKITDGILASLFLIQGLFTFSRGGILAGALSLVLFIYVIYTQAWGKIKFPAAVRKYSLPALILFLMAIYFTNEFTDGKLLLRYQGETEGTLIGSREKDLATVTSGRNTILSGDIDLWMQYPVLGSGAGTSRFLRPEGQGMPAHIEFSRLLAEHGLAGLIIFLLLLSLWSGLQQEKRPDIKALKMALFALALITTFHSATRTFITPLLISICMLNIKTPIKLSDTISGK